MHQWRIAAGKAARRATSNSNLGTKVIGRSGHAPPFVILMAADHTQLGLRVMASTALAVVRLVALSLALLSASGPSRKARERRWRVEGSSVGPGSPCESMGGHSIRLFLGAVPPGEYRQFESIAPACQIRLRGVRGSMRKSE